MPNKRDIDDDSGWRDYAENNPDIYLNIKWRSACAFARLTVQRLNIEECNYILGTRYGGAADCAIYEELRANGLLDEKGELTFNGLAAKWVLENSAPPPRFG